MAADSPIPLARPVLGPEEEAGVIDVLRSGRLSLGPRLAEFEAGHFLAALAADESALAIASGSANARYNFALALQNAGYALDAEGAIAGPDADLPDVHLHSLPAGSTA